MEAVGTTVKSMSVIICLLVSEQRPLAPVGITVLFFFLSLSLTSNNLTMNCPSLSLSLSTFLSTTLETPGEETESGSALTHVTALVQERTQTHALAL